MASPAPNIGPTVGQVLTPFTFDVDEPTVSSYYQGLDLEPTSHGLLPSTLLSKPDNDYILEAAYANRFGHLWLRQGWKFSGALKQGASYAVTGAIQSVYPRRDRNVVQYETVVQDASGRIVARSDHHQSFLADPDAKSAVSLRDPNKKPGARKFDIPAGERFGELKRTISVAMCGEFFHGKSSYHTDANASRELGFTDIVVGGRMTMAYAAHILEEQFGQAWYDSGQIDVKFTNPVWAGDELTVTGVLTGPSAAEPARESAFVWITRTDGAVVLVASASVAR